ncbi:MAG: hypothetical protein AB8B56_11950 [Crocinitomicaceae bacterium]
MKRTNLYKLIIAALVIINVVILIFFFTGGPKHGPPKAGDLSIELGIEGENKDIITKLEEAHHKEKKKLIKLDRKLHDLLFSKMGTGEDVVGVQDKIKENYGEIERITYDFFDEVSTHCTDKQKEQLKKMVRGAFDHGRGRKGPPKK